MKRVKIHYDVSFDIADGGVIRDQVFMAIVSTLQAVMSGAASDDNKGSVVLNTGVSIQWTAEVEAVTAPLGDTITLTVARPLAADGGSEVKLDVYTFPLDAKVVT